MQTEVQISGGKAVEFSIVRDGVELPPVKIVPARDEISGVYLIKAYSMTNSVGAVAWMPARSPLKQLAWDAGSIFRVLEGLLTPREAKATAGALGGPVMIAENIYKSMRRSPWDGLGFLRFVNVNLAVLNLLPIPVLDGGLIMFSLFALVFRRRLPDCVVKYSSLLFMVVLMGLMGLLIVKDSWRSWKMHTREPAVEKAAEADSENGAKDTRD
jgi:regulator of sigma E protease